MKNAAIVFENELRVPGDVFSLEKFRDWAHSPEFPPSGWISYIAGEIEVEMSPEEIQTHNKVKICLAGGILVWVETRDLGEVLGDRAFLVNEAADLATEPDLIFVSWKSLRAGKVSYAERRKGSQRYVEVVGTPDLVAEVVSDGSVRKDTLLLRERYWRAGVPEYWLVDARGKDLVFKLLRRRARGYAEAAPDKKGYRSSAVLGAWCSLIRGRNPVGGWAYRLLMR